MSQHKQNLYEGMYVIKATLSEEARRKALDKIQAGITQHGGEIVKIIDHGRRRLAYPIEGQREGHYYIVYFNILPASVEELWQEYHLNEDLVRFMTLRTDKVLEKIEFKVLEEVQ